MMICHCFSFIIINQPEEPERGCLGHVLEVTVNQEGRFWVGQESDQKLFDLLEDWLSRFQLFFLDGRWGRHWYCLVDVDVVDIDVYKCIHIVMILLFLIFLLLHCCLESRRRGL